MFGLMDLELIAVSVILITIFLSVGLQPLFQLKALWRYERMKKKKVKKDKKSCD